jgi:phospholipid/cholesterol/gamma-HCH transport system substrate-binding protein
VKRGQRYAGRVTAVRVVLVVALLVLSGCGGEDEPPPPTVEARFADDLKVRRGDPVRVAGVDIGQVDEVRREGAETVLVLRREKPAWFVTQRAEVKVRPRIFEEGRFFLDLGPALAEGGPELQDGDSIPVSRTSLPPSYDELLQDPDRRKELKEFYDEYKGDARPKP